MNKTLTSLSEVNGGGEKLKTDWKEGLPPDAPLKVLKERGEARIVEMCVSAFARTSLAKVLPGQSSPDVP